MKFEYKKHQKEFYVPKNKPSIIEIPAFPFFTCKGQGSPDDPCFSEVVEALYTLSYSVKMSYKQAIVPKGYYEYTVFPLEGIWDLLDYRKGVEKSNFKYTMMIRQPNFIDEELFLSFKEQAYKKKKKEMIKEVNFEIYQEGWVCQCMHIGPYREEPATFAMMEAYCEEQGYERSSKLHREIYVSDPRKSAPEKMKTVLRFHVHKKKA